MRVVTRASISASRRRRSAVSNLASAKGSSASMGRLEALQHQKGGLVDRIGRAVAEHEARGLEAAHRIAEPVARRRENGDPLLGVLHRAPPGSKPAGLRRPDVRRDSRRRAYFDALLALGAELPALLAMQALGVGLLRAFLRTGLHRRLVGLHHRGAIGDGLAAGAAASVAKAEPDARSPSPSAATKIESFMEELSDPREIR